MYGKGVVVRMPGYSAGKREDIANMDLRTATLGTEEIKWPLWRGDRYGEVGVLYGNFFREYNMFLCAKFMLTVSHNHGNPIIYNV